MNVPDECPKYRVRLFLSVDLCNSTAFKSARKPHEWVNVFRDFYSDFSDKFRQKHLRLAEKFGESFESLKENRPKLWKTVGDEIIFANRVDSCFEVYLLVKAFADALHDYGSTLGKDQLRKSLGVKGNAWICSFPYPNIAIDIPNGEAGGTAGLGNSERLELSADQNPHLHEFLGKGLDYGFRIGQNSSEDFFSVSPALAHILARPSVNEDYGDLSVKLCLRSPIKLKGVLDGRDYPVIGIPIDRNDEWAAFRGLQDKLLGGDQSNVQEMRDYFRKFILLHEVEEPCLKVRPEDQDQDPPQYYFDEYVPNWEGAAKEIAYQDELIEDASGDDAAGNEPTDAEKDGLIQRIMKQPKS